MSIKKTTTLNNVSLGSSMHLQSQSRSSSNSYWASMEISFSSSFKILGNQAIKLRKYAFHHLFTIKDNFMWPFINKDVLRAWLLSVVFLDLMGTWSLPVTDHMSSLNLYVAPFEVLPASLSIHDHSVCI